MVNSVTGMTNQVAKDKGIQNGVASAAKYRKEIASMEAAEKEGKSSVANRWVFGQDSSSWINSDDVNESFNVKYQPYVDVNKKWMETMKSLHSDLQEQDIPYERNNDGSINYGKTAAAMQRISRETVSAGKIANALSAAMTPDELNQLNIDGRYTFRGVTPDALAKNAEAKFSTQIKDNNDRIRELQGLAQLSASDPEKQKKAKDAIENIKLQNSELQKNYENEVSLISSNLEGAKGMIYKNGAVAQFATANAWEHNKSNLLSNPVLEAEHWEKDYAMDKAKYALDVKKQNWSEYMDKAKYDLDVQKELREAKKLNIELYGMGSEFTSYGGVSTKIKNPLVAMKDDAASYSAAASAGIVEMVKAMPGTSSTQIKQALTKFQAGDPNWFKVGQDSKSIIPLTLQSKAKEIISNRKSAARLNTAIKQSEAEVENSPEMRQINAQIAASVKGLPVLNSTVGGKKTTYSQKEIVDYLNKKLDPANATYNVGGGAFMTPSKGAQQERNKGLTNREIQLQNLLDNTQIGREVANRYRRATGGTMMQTAEKRKSLMEASLLKKAGTYLPTMESITISSEHGGVARNAWQGVVNTALFPYAPETAGGKGGGTEELGSEEYAKAKAWVTGKDKENIAYAIVRQGANKTFVQMTLNGEDVLVPIAKDDVSKLPNRGGSTNISPMHRDVIDAQQIGNGSTNPTGKFEDSYFDNTNIGGISLNVGVDLDWDKSNNATQFINMRLKTPIGELPLMINSPLDRDLAINFIQGLTDSQIKALYLKDPNISKNQQWVDAIKKM